MPSPGFTSVRELEGAVKAGTLAEADINKRAAEVAKIAAATKLVGVGRDDLLSDDIAKAHHDIARTVAEHSSVLLKNDAAALPLKPGTRVAVIGDMAATATLSGFRLIQGERQPRRRTSSTRSRTPKDWYWPATSRATTAKASRMRCC